MNDLEKYQKYVKERLNALTPIFAKASIGDFSEDVEIPEGEDEFSELYAGIGIMLEVIREQINSLKSAKEIVEEEKILDDAILDSIGDGVVVTNKNLNITLMNHHAQMMTEYTDEEAQGKHLFEVLKAVDEKNIPISYDARGTEEAIEKRKKTSVNYFYLTKSGSQLPVSVTTSPLILGDQIIGTVVVFRDRTKDLEVEKMKNEFISLAAHQLRSPLSIMRWNLELFMSQNSSLPKKEKDKLDSVYKNVMRMIALVNDMLSVSKIDQGKTTHQIEPVNIIAIINDVLNEVEVVAENKMVGLAFNHPEEEVFVLADREKLPGVILNLLDNAIKFNTLLGKVEVNITKEGEDVVVQVSDSGIGIPPEDKEQVFDRYYRATNAVFIQFRPWALFS